MAVSRANKRLAVIKSSWIEIWQLDKSEEHNEEPAIEVHEDGRYECCMLFTEWDSSGYRSLDSGGVAHHVAKVWSLETKQCVAELHGHADVLTCVQFAPLDGQLVLATGSEDKKKTAVPLLLEVRGCGWRSEHAYVSI